MVSTANKRRPRKSGNRKKQQKPVRDYGNDPFFVKKAEESKVFLEKNGFPAELLAKK